jgi:hypothetical protein
LSLFTSLKSATFHVKQRMESSQTSATQGDEQALAKRDDKDHRGKEKAKGQVPIEPATSDLGWTGFSKDLDLAPTGMSTDLSSNTDPKRTKESSTQLSPDEKQNMTEAARR